MKKTAFILSLAWMAFACGNSPEKTEEAASEVIDMHNSQVAIEYHGTYTGILPCADCEGIRTDINLGAGDTYTIRQIYLGKSDKAVLNNGKFRWDESGGIAIFDGMDAPNQYRVGENILIQLDINGNQVTGDLSQMYILRK